MSDEKNDITEGLADYQSELVLANLRRELLLSTARGWMPSENEMLVGRVDSIEEREGNREEKKSPYLMYTIEDSMTGSFIVVHAFHQLLRESMEEAEVEVDDIIAVMYGGFKADKDDKEKAAYHRYGVKMVRKHT